MSSHLVSVLIPLYNKEAYVAQTVASALAQTHQHLEVLVIDDGSSDDSLRALRSLNDPRLRLISRENRGANATRNELLELAAGEFVQLLDADDLIRPTKVADQLKLMSKGVDGVLCRYSVSPDVITKDPDSHPMFGFDLVGFLADEGVVTVAPLYRRDALLRAGGFDESLSASQEYELHLRLALTGEWSNVLCVDKDLATWRRVGQSISSNNATVYAAKVQALKSLLGSAETSQHRASLSKAMVNAGLHLARLGRSTEATYALKTASQTSAKSVDALPRRKKYLLRFPKVLVQLEHLEFGIRSSHFARRALSMLEPRKPSVKSWSTSSRQRR